MLLAGQPGKLLLGKKSLGSLRHVQSFGHQHGRPLPNGKNNSLNIVVIWWTMLGRSGKTKWGGYGAAIRNRRQRDAGFVLTPAYLKKAEWRY